MTEEIKDQREELRLKMNGLQEEVRKLRQQIKLIDDAEDELTRSKILGKCFRMNAGDSNSPSWHGYAKVESFDEHFQPIGTTINWYSETLDSKSMMVCQLNMHLHLDWIQSGVEIPQEEFDSYLNQFRATLNQ